MQDELIDLGWWQLSAAAALVVLLAAVMHVARLGLGRETLIATARMIVQLAIVAVLLETLFAVAAFHWVALMAVAMLLLAGREVMARQKRRFTGGWAFGIGTVSMCLSSFTVTVFALAAMIRPTPWYTPQYAIPLLGMLLGNTMTGVALAMDRLTDGAWRQRQAIEGRLMLGVPAGQAIADLRRDAIRSGMIPVINGMAAAGIVSLPGMMTGQILAGSPPALAVEYQLFVFLLVAVGTGFGTVFAVIAASGRLFDERQRLRLERLAAPVRDRT